MLQPSDPRALSLFAEAVSTPGSAAYRDFLPRGSFASVFGPTPATVASVEHALEAIGLTPGTLSSDGLTISVSAPAALIERALNVTLDRVDLVGGRVAFANNLAPQLPASISSSISAVVGLNDLVLPQHLAVTATPAVRDNVSAPQACSTASSMTGASGPFTVDNLASAYGLTSLYGAGAFGSGETVGVYELEPLNFDGTNGLGDIAAFESCEGVDAPVTTEAVDGGPTAQSGGTTALESTLDVETIAGLAPGASLVVYQGPNNATGPFDTYQQMVDDDTTQVISSSWGACESSEQYAESDSAAAENLLFEQAAAQGQTVLAASGDDGATGCSYLGGSTDTTDLAVMDPASQPFVTGVGGTDLTVAHGATPQSESAWTSSTGGISEFWPMPSYQQDTSLSLNVDNGESHTANTLTATEASEEQCNATTTLCREVPDVSANAGNVDLIYWHGHWQDVDGTSAAAPLWAAIIAIANATDCSGTSVGFLNPSLYAIASGTSYSADFHDVTSGRNASSGPYVAGTGYDMVTGLGTPIASGLVPSLCADAPAAVSATNSTVVPSAAVVSTLSPASASVTVTLRNAEGATESDHRIVLSATGSSTISPSSVLTNASGIAVFSVSDSTAETVSLTARDTFDNVTIAAQPSVTFVSPPSVSAIAPNAAVVGAMVTVSGSGFGAATGVSFGLAALSTAQFTVTSSTSLVAEVPSGVAGTVAVSVTNEGGTSPSVSADEFTVGVPSITAVTPSSGPASGGTAVEITGSGFTNATAVHFGSTNATSFSIKTDGTLSATAPAVSSEEIDLTVTNAAGTSATSSLDHFSYIFPPATSATSSLSTTRSRVPGNGVSNAVVSVTLRDQSGTLLPGKAVHLRALSGHPAIVAVSSVTNAAGTASFDVRDRVGQRVKLKADDVSDNVALSRTISLIFTPSASAALSSVSANPAHPPSACVSDLAHSTVTVHLKGAKGITLPQKVIALKANAPGVTVTPRRRSTAKGSATFAIATRKSGRVVVTVTDVSDEITLTHRVTITFARAHRCSALR